MVLCFCGQFLANVGMRRYVFQYIRLNDDRIRYFRDLLYAIKGVKLLAYEPFFYKMIQSFREIQLGALTTWMRLTFCLFTSFNQAVPGMAAGATFLAYYLLDGSLRSDIIFPTLAYINMLYQPVSQASLSFSRQFSVWPCGERIRDLFKLGGVRRLQPISVHYFTGYCRQHGKCNIWLPLCQQ